MEANKDGNRLIAVALDFARAAVKADEENKIIVAVENYDMCILHIDEILSKLQEKSELYRELLSLRMTYDDRMEALREYATSGIFGNSGEKGTMRTIFRRRGRSSQSNVQFEEDNSLPIVPLSQRDDFDLQPPPELIRRPYWLLNMLKHTIAEGGRLTPSLYISKQMWLQVGVKFSGLGAKSSAYQALIFAITSNISPLSIDGADSSLIEITAALKMTFDEFVVIQNQLSKSFQFIESRVMEVEEEVSPAKGQVARLTGIVSQLGKNVRKYAEVGLSRISALPSHISDDDFSTYVLLTSCLCEHSQVFDTLYVSATKERERLLTQICGVEKKALVADRLALVETILGLLYQFSDFMRVVVCEIIMRDARALACRYLRKTKKSLQRLFWTEESVTAANVNAVPFI